jgi:hypothetical protein
MDVSKMYVEEFFGGCDKISLLELAKIQAKVLVPVIRALRKELGTERANQIVADALRRNRKITITTSATASSSSNCTSCTEARMVTVRSVSSA